MRNERYWQVVFVGLVVLFGTITGDTFAQSPPNVEPISEEAPVETPTAGNADDPLDKIIDEPSKLHVSGGYAAHPVLLKHFKEMTYSYTGGRYNETPIRYRLRTPKETKPGQKYPLIVWFHGAGESDDDNIRQIAHLHHVIDYISGEKRDDFYVLATQCPKDNASWFGSVLQEGQGDAPITITREIMNHLIQEYPIDPDCITAGGLSAGGSALWRFIEDQPGVIVAATPFSSNPPQAVSPEKFKGTSIWVFNCAGDAGTPIENIRSVVTRLKNSGCTIALTEYPSASHDSWGPAFRKDDAFGWLIEQRKNGWWSPLPGRPYSLQRLTLIASPLLAPAIFAIITLVVLRDRRLRKKRLLAVLQNVTEKNVQNEVALSDDEVKNET